MFDPSRPYECSANVDSSFIDSSAPQWYHYFLCGYLGILEVLQQRGGLQAANFGIDIMVCGKVPPSAGLSSSSALVCSSALITYQLLSQISLTKVSIVCVFILFSKLTN